MAMRFIGRLARELQIGDEWVGALEGMSRSAVMYVAALTDNIGRYVPSRLVAASIAMSSTFRRGFLKALLRTMLAVWPRNGGDGALAVTGLSLALSCVRERDDEPHLIRRAYVGRDMLEEAMNYVYSTATGLRASEAAALSLAVINMAVVTANLLPNMDAAMSAIFNETAIPAISELSYATG